MSGFGAFEPPTRQNDFDAPARAARAHVAGSGGWSRMRARAAVPAVENNPKNPIPSYARGDSLIVEPKGSDTFSRSHPADSERGAPGCTATPNRARARAVQPEFERARIDRATGLPAASSHKKIIDNFSGAGSVIKKGPEKNPEYARVGYVYVKMEENVAEQGQGSTHAYHHLNC